MDNLRTFIILIGGGTASGKSTLAKLISKSFSEMCVEPLLITTDNYYKDLSHLPIEERAKTNFDEPSAIEHQLLISNLVNLIKGIEVNAPLYDFTTHTRSKNLVKLKPSPVIIVEGLYALYYEELRALGNLKIYVDVPDDIRVIRRILRDINERNRTLNSVIEQYINTVRSMYISYILPTKRFADIVVNGEDIYGSLATVMNHPKIKTYVENLKQ